jgi:hypothetical protein
MSRHYKIKNPTLRKVKNRKFEPVIYHITNTKECRIVSGWIYKRGRKYLYFYSPSTGRRRVLKSEERYMRKIP